MEKEKNLNLNEIGRIEGRNAVTEALKSDRPIDKIFIAEESDSALRHLAKIAQEKGIPVVRVARKKLDIMSVSRAHQGIIAQAAATRYAQMDDIFEAAEKSGRPPLIVVLDGISDPGNLGAICRSAECAGAHGIILPKRHSAGLTPVAAKSAAGALSWIPVVKVPNITAALEELKERGVWIYGTAAEGSSEIYKTDMKGPCAIVIGSEGEGMGRLVREHCDFLVSIPMEGHITSLNASVAAGVMLFEVVRQRREAQG